MLPIILLIGTNSGQKSPSGVRCYSSSGQIVAMQVAQIEAQSEGIVRLHRLIQ
jgi:hypothetical protein